MTEDSTSLLISLSIYQTITLFVQPPIYLSINHSIFLSMGRNSSLREDLLADKSMSTNLIIHLSNNKSVRLATHLSIYKSINLSSNKLICIAPPIHQYFFLSIYLSFKYDQSINRSYYLSTLFIGGNNSPKEDLLAEDFIFLQQQSNLNKL